MRTMDQGQLQKMLNAAAVASTQNNMMLFPPIMTTTATTANQMTSSSSCSSSPTTTTTTTTTTTSSTPPALMWPSSLKPDSLEANLAVLLFLQQHLQQAQTQNNQQATPTITTPTSLPPFPFFPTATPASTTVTTPTPQSSTPPEVLSNLLLLQMTQQAPCATPPDTNRKVSNVSLPSEFVPLTSGTPSGSTGSLPASSPSTSSKKEEEDEEGEEEEEDEFVDIESVEVAIDGKEKRKAHVEFYRRMKYMRQHFREKSLTCHECKKKIDNQENAIAVHVAEHADSGGYQCRLCGWQSLDKYRIYSHMRQDHPRKVDMFVDKRDMPKMCRILSQCFPKTTCRPKRESNRNADTYLSAVIKCGSGAAGEQICDVCKGRVRRDKAAMIRHVQTNHTIKCKTCKTISQSLEEQFAHQQESHQLTEPKMSVHYAPSAAAIYLLPALEKCFPQAKN